MRLHSPLTCFLAFALAAPLFAQDAATGKYWVEFTDKGDSPWSVDRPEEFLSPRAVERRRRQRIAIDESDLPVSPQRLEALKDAGAQVVHVSRWFNAATVTLGDAAQRSGIAALPFVQNVRHVLVYRKEADYELGDLPEDALRKNGGTDRADAYYDYGLSFHQTYMLGGDYMHVKGYRGSGMVIAVIDAGFWEVGNRIMFDSLRAQGRLLGTRDFVDGGTSVYEDHTHGMQVLSVMAGNMPGNLVGTAPEASYWLLRSEESQTEYVVEEDNWVVAAEFADSAGADIINSSLGYSTFMDTTQNHTYADMDGKTTVVTKGADMAASKGILVVNSAGNMGAGSWKYITAPADGKKVLAVGAVDQFKMWAYFSSQGPSYDGRVKPNVTAQGLSTIIASVAPDTSPGPRIQTGSGTSFSAPLIAGLAACLWQKHPTATNLQVLTAIEQSGDQYFAPDTLQGYGVPNFAVASLILDGMTKGDFTDDRLVTAYPNPFRDRLHFVFYSSVNQTVTVEITDMLGSMVHWEIRRFISNSYNDMEVEDVRPLPQGMYFLSVSTPIETYTAKVFRY